MWQRERRGLTRPPRGAFVLAAFLLSAGTASPQEASNTQLWLNLILDKVSREGLTLEVDFEPKTLVSEEGDYAALDVTPAVEYALRDWLDLTGELAMGYAKESEKLDTFELSPRVGLRFHLFSQRDRLIFRERLPKKRWILRDLVRLESRNIFYLGGGGTDTTWRLRNRIEFICPINHPSYTTDRTLYLLADWELFAPLDVDAAERFANRQRVRAGLGYRHDYGWRVELLYAEQRSRNTIEEDFETSDHIVNFRIKRFFYIKNLGRGESCGRMEPPCDTVPSGRVSRWERGCGGP